MLGFFDLSVGPKYWQPLCSLRRRINIDRKSSLLHLENSPLLFLCT